MLLEFSHMEYVRHPGTFFRAPFVERFAVYRLVDPHAAEMKRIANETERLVALKRKLDAEYHVLGSLIAVECRRSELKALMGPSDVVDMNQLSHSPAIAMKVVR